MKQENPPPSWVLRTHFSRAVYYRSDPCIDASWFDLLWKPISPFPERRFVKPKQPDKGLVFISSAPSLDVYYQAPLAPSKVMNHDDSMEGHDFSFTFPSALVCTSRVCDSPLKTKDTSDFFSIPQRDEQMDALQEASLSSHGVLSMASDSLSLTPPRRCLSANNVLKQQEVPTISVSKASSFGRTFSKCSLKGSPRWSSAGTPKDSPYSSQANSPGYVSRSTDAFNENFSISLNQGSRGSIIRRDMTRALSWSDHLSNASGNEKAVLSAENWMIDLSQLFLGERFASGTYSRIYRGKYVDTPVAVKVIRQPDEDALLAERLEKSFLQEVTILSCLQHHNVIKFIAACKKPPVLCVITEYLPGGSIRSFLHNREGQLLPIPQVLQMALDIAYGMEYLHMKGVVHRDLKSENLVLGEDDSVKILDFGVACFESECNSCGDDLGTYRWMAPEMLSKKPYTRKVDVYSFGIVLWELLTGHLPYEDMGAVQAAFCVVHENTRPPIPPDCPALLKDLMCRCWTTEPEERPEFWEILRLLNMCRMSISNSQEVI